MTLPALPVELVNRVIEIWFADNYDDENKARSVHFVHVRDVH
jgi:hypothetical protein